MVWLKAQQLPLLLNLGFLGWQGDTWPLESLIQV